MHASDRGRRPIIVRDRPAPLIAALVVAGMLLFAPSALAAGESPPEFIHAELKQLVFSTRATIATEVEGGGEAGFEAKAEYSISKTGPWTEDPIVIEDESGGLERLRLGMREPNFEGLLGAIWLRGLTPDTQYYARFLAKNAASPGGVPTEEIVPFKTLPVAEPEVNKVAFNEFINDGEPWFVVGEVTDTATSFTAEIEDNGAKTEYTFEYAPAEVGGGRPGEGSAAWKPFTSGASGTISEAEEHAAPGASLTGLTPETTYYVRLKMSNSAGTAVQTTYRQEIGAVVSSFTTGTARPVTGYAPGVRNRTVNSVHVHAGISPHGSATRWRFEYAESELGPWNIVPGGAGEGTISQAQAEALPYSSNGQEEDFGVGATITGLRPATEYYVRLFTENAAGEGEFCGPEEGHASDVCELIGEGTRAAASFETLGPPSVRTFAIHSLVGEALQLDGGVDSKSTPTSAEQTITIEGAPTGGTFTLKFDGHETAPIAYNAPGRGQAGTVGQALDEIGAGGEVEGPAGGPYTIFGPGATGVSEPQIEANGSGLTPSGKVTVHTDFKGGETSETRYRFLYVSQASFAEHGWAGAQETPEAAAPVGGELEVVDALLPVLTAGETYRYRVVATSSVPGVGVIEGAEQTLTVPVPPKPGVEASCPNEAFRTGLSARLPDCRAYEQLSPVEKHGSQEPFQYGIGLGTALVVGEDGEHAVLEGSGVSWDVGAEAGGSPYLFSRVAGKGWETTAGSPQPETGLENVYPQLYSADATQVAFEAKYISSQLSYSKTDEYKVGPVGGPYVTVASIPAVPADEGGGGWVAANGSFSKLIFGTRDRELLDESTGTRSGADLYEYTAQGGLSQLNVSGGAGEPGATIGTCGASFSGISSDGSRVFFDAGCVPELYMRVNGEETVEIGAYRLVDTNAQGTVLLLENGAHELFDYDTETGVPTPFSRSGGEVAAEHATEQELAALGIPDEKTIEVGEGSQPFSFSHPRYTYWGESGQHAGVGTKSPHNPDPEEGQAYRYDSIEHLVQCISCASPSDPDPKLAAFITSGVGSFGLHGDQSGIVPGGQGGNEPHFGSVNGKFAFFTTPAALVPQDVDGEYELETCGNGGNGGNECYGGLGNDEYHDIYGTTSLSSDIYEWRAGGVDGCARLDGCLALITDGRGGFMNLLLGTADEGRDVYFYTRSTMVAQTGRPEGSLGEANIYDARVDGGFAPVPPRPTECEGDACSSPPSPPSDQTPSSLTFSGAGNVAPVGGLAPNHAAKKQAAPKKKNKAKKKRARSKRKGKKAGRGARDRRAR
jgi:hypothetical protein